MAFLDAGRVVAFAPGAGLGPEPGRNELPGRAAAGRVRRFGVQEVRLEPGRPGRIQAAGFVHEDPGVGPGDRPGLKGGQGQRQRRRQGPGFGEEGRGGAFADGQDTGDLGHQCHLLDGAVPRGRRRRRQEPGCLRVVGGQPHPQRGRPGLHPGDLGEPVQATVRQPPQRIAVSHRVGSRRIGGRPSAGPAKAASAATEAATASTAAPLSALNAVLLSTLRSSQEPPTIFDETEVTEHPAVHF